MTLSSAKPSVSYSHSVEGTWGEFSTPSGKVTYILTKARLGAAGVDRERRLTSHLTPVREVLDPKELDFNQLLQRDLDDHRVAHDLLPYVLSGRTTSPCFFPPIMAVLLPFDVQKPVHFPDAEEPTQKEIDGLLFRERAHGPAFCEQRLIRESGDDHEVKLGRLCWNTERCKLVVLDGQHRAMALIAIDRTLNRTWEKSSGARYRHFYEKRVRDLLKEKEFDLSNVEVPVAVCWFPDLVGPSKNPHLAARSLFVDVNKEARRPSEARLILLSDTQLINIFTRTLLNRLRQDDPPIPIYSIEYDNPGKDQARPVRWSVLANLHLLKNSIYYTLFCPKSQRKSLKGRWGGRPNWSEMNQRMRKQLDLKNKLESVIEDEDGSIKREEIGNKHFPRASLTTLQDQFMKSWGEAILTILGGLLPYSAHCQALERLHDEWLKDDAMASLAHEALFHGVGTYWTLRSSHLHWQEHVANLRAQKLKPPPTPEIVKAWEILESDKKESKRVRFSELRAHEYLGKETKDSVEKSDQFYAVANTHACQLGAILTLTTLCELEDKEGSAVPKLAALLVEAWNAALTAKVTNTRDRRLVFSKSIKNPVNRIRKLDKPFATYFRYFWLELLRTPEALAVLDKQIDVKKLHEAAARAGNFYLDYLEAERVKSLKEEHPDWPNEKLKTEARKREEKEIRKALGHWFGVKSEKLEAWLTPRAPDTVEDGEPAGALSEDEDVDGETDEGEDLGSSDGCIEDILNALEEDD